MLSEYASPQTGQQQQQQRGSNDPLPTLGFEPSQGGQSYGLEEVCIRAHYLNLLSSLLCYLPRPSSSSATLSSRLGESR